MAKKPIAKQAFQWKKMSVPLVVMLAFLTLVLPMIVYFWLGESSAYGATWGKRKADIRVVKMNGKRLSRQRAFSRNLVKFLPWQMAHSCLFHIEGWPLNPVEPPAWVTGGFILVGILVAIYAGTAVFTKTHRTPYDWAASSAVIVNEPGRFSHSPV